MWGLPLTASLALRFFRHLRVGEALLGISVVSSKYWTPDDRLQLEVSFHFVLLCKFKSWLV